MLKVHIVYRLYFFKQATVYIRNEIPKGINLPILCGYTDIHYVSHN